MNEFRVGDFALIQGHLVEILEIHRPQGRVWDCKVKLIQDNLTHWLLATNLTPIENQATAKVLYGHKSHK